jgi:NAD(P)-dependent dehydrogenase (short-subunit alcohol dehydrogenase family)
MADGAVDINWQPRVALITGAGSGIGRQLALTFAAEGMAVAGIDLRAEGQESLAKELPGKFAWEIADVTDAAAVRSAGEALEAKVGPVDLLVASAGMGCETSALFADADSFNKVIQVNLLGVANSIHAVLPGMLRRRRGHLVALSSLASYRGLPFMAAYCASKSGVNALMESYRVELAPHGIFTTTVCPGWIRTPMTANLKMKVPMLEVADAAARIAAAIRRRKKFVAFPRGPRRTLAWVRALPTWFGDWLVGRLMRSMAKQRGG